MRLTDCYAKKRVACRRVEVLPDGRRRTTWEPGRVSSTNATYIFVRLDTQVARLGWEAAPSQVCVPGDVFELDDL